MKFASSIEISIQGIETERFLNMCTHHSIILSNVYSVGTTYYASLHPLQFFSLKSLSKKANVKIRIKAKQGILFWIKKNKCSKLLYLFPCVCLCILWMSSHYLWNIQLNGNSSLTHDVVRDYLLERGVHYGMPLSDIPIANLKEDIRKAYPQIHWVSIFLDGTTLQISIKENPVFEYEPDQNLLSENVIAPISGIIDSVLLRKGTLNAAVGDNVEKGDILILGNVEVLSEDGSVKKVIPCKADGDIYLISEFHIDEKLPLAYKTKNYTGQTLRNYEITLGNQSFCLWSNTIPYKHYDLLTKDIEHPLTTILSLPIKIKENIYSEYLFLDQKYTPQEAEKILNKKLDKICETLEEKGVQIMKKNVKIESNSVSSRMRGFLTIRVLCSKHNNLEENP